MSMLASQQHSATLYTRRSLCIQRKHLAHTPLDNLSTTRSSRKWPAAVETVVSVSQRVWEIGLMCQERDKKEIRGQLPELNMLHDL